jgi:uracil-DNA glycosylase
LSHVQPNLQLILLGRVAQQIPNRGLFQCFEAEHPYQRTFIHNAEVLAFFQPLKVLET